MDTGVKLDGSAGAGISRFMIEHCEIIAVEATDITPCGISVNSTSWVNVIHDVTLFGSTISHNGSGIVVTNGRVTASVVHVEYHADGIQFGSNSHGGVVFLDGNYVTNVLHITNAGHQRVSALYLGRAGGTNTVLDDNTSFAVTDTQLPGYVTGSQIIVANGQNNPAVTLTDAPTIAVNAALGNYFIVTLGGNRRMNSPTNPVAGQRITFTVIQDGTGGRKLGWNAVFKTNWSNTGNTANKRSSISFMYDGTNWNQDGARSSYI